MLGELKKLKGKLVGYQKRQHKERVKNYVSSYVEQNGLRDLIARANARSGSTGADDGDYVALHRMIRVKRPRHVLECGTGRTTWVIAHALAQNQKDHGIAGKVTSMESVKVWYDEASSIFPAELRPFADIRLSEPTTFMYGFIKGTCYTELPDLPYEIVFVDGPSPEVLEGAAHQTANMDFVKVVLRSSIPVTAVVDYRLRTVIAYGVIFGKRKVQFLKPWNLGIVENVTKQDILLDDDAVHLKEILAATAQYRDGNPSWIDL